MSHGLKSQAAQSPHWLKNQIDPEGQAKIQSLLRAVNKLARSTAIALEDALSEICGQADPESMLDLLRKSVRYMMPQVAPEKSLGYAEIVIRKMTMQVLMMAIDASLDSIAALSPGEDSETAMAQFRARVESGPKVLTRMIKSGALPSHPNLTVVKEWSGPGGGEWVAMSHVWGELGRTSPQPTESIESKVSHQSGCESGWCVSQSLSKKYTLVTERLGPSWMDAISIPQCCLPHKEPFIGRMFQNFLKAKTTVVVTTSWSDQTELRGSATQEVINLIQDGWFTRGWVVQEIAISRNMVIWDHAKQKFVNLDVALLEASLSSLTLKDPVIKGLLREACYSFRMAQSFPLGLNPLADPCLLMFNKQTTYSSDIINSLANLCQLNVDVDYGRVWDARDAWCQLVKDNMKHLKSGAFRTTGTAFWAPGAYGRKGIPILGGEDRVVWPEKYRGTVLQVCETKGVQMSGVSVELNKVEVLLEVKPAFCVKIDQEGGVWMSLDPNAEDTRVAFVNVLEAADVLWIQVASGEDTPEMMWNAISVIAQASHLPKFSSLIGWVLRRALTHWRVALESQKEDNLSCIAYQVILNGDSWIVLSGEKVDFEKSLLMLNGCEVDGEFHTIDAVVVNTMDEAAGADCFEAVGHFWANVRAMEYRDFSGFLG
ncbi:hypothetical protein HDU98_008463 [Podochytrium sp. JEL0797]|nr:hypothetical protein HDU98_008463 [Podochytrium sp. JEL0797]